MLSAETSAAQWDITGSVHSEDPPLSSYALHRSTGIFHGDIPEWRDANLPLWSVIGMWVHPPKGSNNTQNIIDTKFSYHHEDLGKALSATGAPQSRRYYKRVLWCQ